MSPELDGFELLSAQDDVPGAVLDAVPGDVAELEVVRPGQDALDSPLGQLAGVVLQLVGETGSSLTVKFLSPVDLCTG